MNGWNSSTFLSFMDFILYVRIPRCCAYLNESWIYFFLPRREIKGYRIKWLNDYIFRKMTSLLWIGVQKHNKPTAPRMWTKLTTGKIFVIINEENIKMLPLEVEDRSHRTRFRCGWEGYLKCTNCLQMQSEIENKIFFVVLICQIVNLWFTNK